MILRTQYLERIRPFYDSELIKVITGVRRCGKSVLLKQIAVEIRAEHFDAAEPDALVLPEELDAELQPASKPAQSAAARAALINFVVFFMGAS